jgi:hypothetical protein
VRQRASDVDPRLGARDRRLEVLCQAAVSIEPSKGSFDNPSPWQQLKAGSVRGAFDDLDRPVAKLGQGVMQVGAVVDAVGEQVAQPGKQLVDRLDDQDRNPELSRGGVLLFARFYNRGPIMPTLTTTEHGEIRVHHHQVTRMADRLWRLR